MTREDISARLDILRKNLEQLEAVPQGSMAELTGDFRNVPATLHLLQTDQLM